jgi:integrase
MLLSVVRELPPRDRCLITAQWFTGFRISEILSLTVGSVLRNGEIVSKIGVAPRNMKGGYGRTRWIPVLPELQRALESYLGWLRRRLELSPAMPLFISREGDGEGNLLPLTRESARRIMHAAFAAAGVENDGRLGTHTLRKTWARKVYEIRQGHHDPEGGAESFRRLRHPEIPGGRRGRGHGCDNWV